jgi:hypothetical protein
MSYCVIPNYYVKDSATGLHYVHKDPHFLTKIERSGGRVEAILSALLGPACVPGTAEKVSQFVKANGWNSFQVDRDPVPGIRCIVIKL